MGNIFDKEVVD